MWGIILYMFLAVAMGFLAVMLLRSPVESNRTVLPLLTVGKPVQNQINIPI
jgi:hypothetical protein